MTSPAPASPRTPAETRPALILGARSDMGRAVAHLLAAEGRPILLAGRDVAALERDAADIAARHRVEARALAWDAADLAGHAAWLDALPETPGVVLSAVGLLGDQDATQEDPARIAEIVTANFTGPAMALEAEVYGVWPLRVSSCSRLPPTRRARRLSRARGSTRPWAFGASRSAGACCSRPPGRTPPFT